MEIIKEKKTVKIDPELKETIKTLVEEESQVIIHLCLNSSSQGRMRIWKSTFLIPKHSGKKSQLVHSENIGIYPNWSPCVKGKNYCILIFKGLPKDCSVFDLIEEIPEPGGFIIYNIPRNNSDVYHLEINY